MHDAWEEKIMVKQSNKSKAPILENVTIGLIEPTGSVVKNKFAQLFKNTSIKERFQQKK